MLLAGCSAIDFAYNNASGFVASEADDAFDLDDAQKAEVDRRLQDFFAWHRREELVRYRDFLNGAAATIGDGITAQEFLELGEELRAAWRRSFVRVIDDLGDLALTLTPAQIDHYDRYFREKSEEYDDYLRMSAQQREIYRVQQGLDRLEDWFGEFGDIQRDRISLRLQELPDFYPAWIRYREARHRALMEALRATGTSSLTRQRLHFILVDPESEHARVFYAARSEYWQAYGQMLQEISASFTGAQLQHAVERLHTFADIAGSLARSD